MAGRSRPKDGVLSHTYVPAMTGETHCLSTVMPGHRRPKDGVLSHTYVPGIHVFLERPPRRGWPGQARP
jgi:hypothetical protein